jgi:hypothetical protein
MKDEILAKITLGEEEFISEKDFVMLGNALYKAGLLCHKRFKTPNEALTFFRAREWNNSARIVGECIEKIPQSGMWSMTRFMKVWSKFIR